MNAQSLHRAVTVLLNFTHPDYHSVMAMSSCRYLMSSSPLLRRLSSDQNEPGSDSNEELHLRLARRGK